MVSDKVWCTNLYLCICNSVLRIQQHKVNHSTPVITVSKRKGDMIMLYTKMGSFNKQGIGSSNITFPINIRVNIINNVGKDIMWM